MRNVLIGMAAAVIAAGGVLAQAQQTTQGQDEPAAGQAEGQQGMGATGQGMDQGMGATGPGMSPGMMGQGGGYGMGPGMMGGGYGMGPGMMGQGIGPGMMMGRGMGPGMWGDDGPDRRGKRHMMMLMFALVDQDGNEELSLEEVQAVHERMFNYADTDDDGSLTMEELAEFMHGGRHGGPGRGRP